MRGSKWTLPLVAVAVVLMGISIKSAVAQNAKGGIKGDVKTADGQPAAGIPLSLFKGTVEMPAFGRGGRRGGGGGAPADGGGTPPATQPALPTPVATATADDKGAYKFEGVEPGDYTLMAGAIGGGGRRGGGAGGPGGGGAAPGGGAGGPGGGGGRGLGRGTANVTVKAGETVTKDIQLQAGRGGRRGGGGGGGGAAPAPGQGA